MLKEFKQIIKESKQLGAPKGFRNQGKRSKEEEIKVQKEASIFKDFRYKGWDVQVTFHQAQQSFDRRPEFKFKDWEMIHKRAIDKLDEYGSWGNGDFLVFSNSLNQGYVISSSQNRKRIRIVTVLPKGRKRPQDGTDMITVESYSSMELFIDFDSLQDLIIE